MLTFLGVTVTWVFFRAQDFPTAMKTLVSMLGVFGEKGDQILATRDLIGVFAVVAVVLAIHRLMRNSSLEALVQRVPRWSRGKAGAAARKLCFPITFLVIVYRAWRTG